MQDWTLRILCVSLLLLLLLLLLAVDAINRWLVYFDE